MSGNQLRLQVPPKPFGVNSWIPQMIRQWILDCWSGDRKCTGPYGDSANSWNWQSVDDIWQIALAGDQNLANCFIRLARWLLKVTLAVGITVIV